MIDLDSDTIADPKPTTGPDPAHTTDPVGDPDHTGGPRDADTTTDQASDGAPYPAPAPDHASAGIEIHVGLLTLLGLDQRPGDIPGWGPVIPEVARTIVTRQHQARWRFRRPRRHRKPRPGRHHPPPSPPRPRPRPWAGCCGAGRGRGRRVAHHRHRPAPPRRRGHHALKHCGGWRLEQPTSGWFRWTSPLQQRYDTRGEPIQPPLPDPLPRPPEPQRPPTTGPREVDAPTFDPKPKPPPPPPALRPPRWRSSHNWPEDPDKPPSPP